VKEAEKVQSVKESFIIKGFKFIKVRYLVGNYVLLSGDLAEAIQKSLLENKD